MKSFIQSKSMYAWEAIEEGPYVPRTEDGLDLPRYLWTRHDYERVRENANAINMIVCGLTTQEGERIAGCETAKEMWEKLQITYEGTDKVKDAKIDLLIEQIESFKMLKEESINDMSNRYLNLVNELKRLGKSYTEEEKVKKILRSLTKDWENKKTAIEEAQDLKSYTYDALIGNLLTHEMHQKRFEVEAKEAKAEKKKNLVLKAARSGSDSDSDDDDDMAAFARRFKRFMRKDKQRRYQKRGESSRGSRGYPKKDRSRKESEEKKEPEKKITCFGCGEEGHIKTKCPKARKEKRRSRGGAMAAWSGEDRDSSSCSSDESESHNALMAIEVSESGSRAESGSCARTGSCSQTTGASESEDSEVNSHSKSLSLKFILQSISAVMKSVEKNTRAIKELNRKVMEMAEDQENVEKDLNEVRVKVHELRIEDNDQTALVKRMEINLMGVDREIDLIKDEIKRKAAQASGTRDRKIRQPQAQRFTAYHKAPKVKPPQRFVYLDKGKRVISAPVIQQQINSNTVKTSKGPAVAKGTHDSEASTSGPKPNLRKQKKTPKGCRFCGRTNHITTMCRFKNGYYDDIDYNLPRLVINPRGPKAHWVPKPT